MAHIRRHQCGLHSALLRLPQHTGHSGEKQAGGSPPVPVEYQSECRVRQQVRPCPGQPTASQQDSRCEANPLALLRAATEGLRLRRQHWQAQRASAWLQRAGAKPAWKAASERAGQRGNRAQRRVSAQGAVQGGGSVWSGPSSRRKVLTVCAAHTTRKQSSK